MTNENNQIFDFDYVDFFLIFFASMTILTLTQSTIQEIVVIFMLCEYKRWVQPKARSSLQNLFATCTTKKKISKKFLYTIAINLKLCYVMT